jgi:hypothetical protein
MKKFAVVLVIATTMLVVGQLALTSRAMAQYPVMYSSDCSGGNGVGSFNYVPHPRYYPTSSRAVYYPVRYYPTFERTFYLTLGYRHNLGFFRPRQRAIVAYGGFGIISRQYNPYYCN